MAAALQHRCRPTAANAATQRRRAKPTALAAPAPAPLRGACRGAAPSLAARHRAQRPVQAASQPFGPGRLPEAGSPGAPPRALQPAATPVAATAAHLSGDHDISAADISRAWWTLMRAWNALPSLALVLLGAWTGAGKTVFALKGLTVWFMGLASSGVAMASCAINDYFDWKLDALNDASKPIPSGAIPPDRALLAAASVYILLLALACAVPNAGVRLIIAFSAVATVLYTPLLKRHTLVKNVVVASTIAAAPLAGALAAGAAGPGLHAVAAPCAFLWLGVLHREIIMDIQDRRGDSAAGVQTLPVVLGPRAALAAGLAPLAACAALGVHAALRGSGLAWAAWPAHAAWLEPALRCVALGAVAWNLALPAAAAWQVLRSGFDRERVSAAISISMKSVGLGTLLLALLA